MNPSDHPVFNIKVEAERCLALCRESDNPIMCLGSLTTHLAQDGWHPGDIREVERTVLDALGISKQAE